MTIKYLDAKRIQGSGTDKATLVTAVDTTTRQSYRINSEEKITVSSPNVNFTVPIGNIASETTGFAGDTLTWDIGSALSTDFVVRAELIFTANTVNTNSATMNGVGLWISDTADGNVEDTQDFCTIVGQQCQNSTPFFGLNARNNAAPEVSFTNGSSVLAGLSVDTYYVQLVRDGDVSTMTITTNSDYTTDVSTGTITTADITGLRYLKATGFTEYRATYCNGTVAGNFQNIKICDDTTTFSAGAVTYEPALADSSDLPENTIFNETDTYSQWWLQNGKWLGRNQPNEISDLWAWWKAESQYMSLNGSGVTTWNPQTNATAYQIKADSSSEEPTFEANGRNGRGIVKFDGSEWLHTTDDSNNITQPMTFVMVMKFPTGASKTIFDVDNTGAGGRILCRSTSVAGKFELLNGGTVNSATVSAVSEAWGYMVITLNGASSKWRINGGNEVTVDVSDNFNPITIGADYGGNNDMTGDIMHFIIYDKELSSSEITEIEAWCANEAGL